MKRRLFNFLAAVSLVLCVTLLTVGIASYRFLPELSISHNTTKWTVDCYRARLGFRIVYSAYDRYPLSASAAYQRIPADPRQRVSDDTPHIRKLWHLSSPSGIKLASDPPAGWRVPDWLVALGFPPDNAISALYINLPVWLTALLAAVLPSLWLRRTLGDRRRSKKGRCLACGYDLTGNVSGVCPECGTAMRNGARMV